MAATVWLPGNKVAIEGETAVSPLNGTGPPRFWPSTENCTVPVGVPVAGAFGETLAVKSTAVPKADGLCDEVTAVVVSAVVEVPVAAMLSSPGNDRFVKATVVPGTGSVV